MKKILTHALVVFLFISQGFAQSITSNRFTYFNNALYDLDTIGKSIKLNPDLDDLKENGDYLYVEDKSACRVYLFSSKQGMLQKGIFIPNATFVVLMDNYIFNFTGNTLVIHTITGEKLVSVDFPKGFTETYLKSVYESIIVTDNLCFIIDPENIILQINLMSGQSRPINSDDASLAVDAFGQNRIITVNNQDLIFIKDLENTIGYQIYKYDINGKKKFSLNLPHSRMTKVGNFMVPKRFLAYAGEDETKIYFNNSSSKQNTIVSKLDGSLSYTGNAYIANYNDSAYLELDNKMLIAYPSRKGIQQWTYKLNDNIKNCQLKTLTTSNTLLAIQYASDKTKISITGIDLLKGKELWNSNYSIGDLKAILNNSIKAATYNNHLILKGEANNLTYLKIIDISTGLIEFENTIHK